MQLPNDPMNGHDQTREKGEEKAKEKEIEIDDDGGQSHMESVEARGNKADEDEQAQPVDAIAARQQRFQELVLIGGEDVEGTASSAIYLLSINDEADYRMSSA